MMCSATTRSSLELMLDSIRQRDEDPSDAPPALPVRPVSRARLPPAKRALPVNFKRNGLRENPKENEARMKIGLLDVMDDTRERALERILEIQKYFRGHQARCYYLELKRGTITLQSFVRGENTRKDYQVLTRRLASVTVIQQHTKRWIEWRTMQKRQRAVICLQSVIRGWLTRRGLNSKRNSRLLSVEPVEDMRKPDWRNPETKDYIQVSPSALADLQKRLLRAGTELGLKEEENTALRQRLQQFNIKWSQYEAKMKSMEKIWQDQLTSLQMSLAAANKSLASEYAADQPGTSDPFPLYHCYDADNTMPVGTQNTDGRSPVDFSKFPCDNEPQQTNIRINEMNRLSEQRKKVLHDNAIMSPDDELQKLTFRFEAWKKDYKIRLQETKTALQKFCHSETKKSRKKWWGR
ncbi:unnamed protein product [Camellia sinensis]